MAAQSILISRINSLLVLVKRKLKTYCQPYNLILYWTYFCEKKAQKPGTETKKGKKRGKSQQKLTRVNLRMWRK